MRRILVVRAGAIGDGLLTLPALAALRTCWPDATITMVGPRALLPFVRTARLVDVGLSIEGAAGLALFGDQPAEPPDWATSDLAVVWLQRWETATRRLRHWGCAHVLAGPSLPPDGASTHVADHLFAALASAGIGPAWPNRPRLVSPAAAETAAFWWQEWRLGDVQPVLAVHPGSGGARKCWPMSRYVQLVEALLADGYGALLLLGPAEERQTGDWQALAPNCPRLAVASNLDLPVAAGLLTHCAGYVGNDSGITHLAAALGVPTVAVFGPTDPARWAPIGPAVRVLRDPGWVRIGREGGEGLWDLAVSDVLAAVEGMGQGLP